MREIACMSHEVSVFLVGLDLIPRPSVVVVHMLGDGDYVWDLGSVASALQGDVESQDGAPDCRCGLVNGDLELCQVTFVLLVS